MKKLFFAMVLLFGLVFKPAQASHVLGGEMSYKCLGNGVYEFTVILFRDCFGIPWSQNNAVIQHNVPGVGAINCPRLPGSQGVVDVSQRCPGNTTFSCGNPPTNGQGPSGTVAMQVFRGTVNLSTAPAPPAAGYVFTMNNIDVNVRNANQNMGGGSAMTLRVIMFPYIDPGTGTALTPNQMCDNSPSFAEPPVALQILNPLDTVTFNNFAFDTDLDSISFHIDFPWTGLFSPMFYTGGFSVTNPWPGILPVVTPLGNVAIDPSGGVVTFRPIQAGNWLTCIRVDAWRCGQRISSIFRDFQMQIIPAPPGSPPPYNPNNPSPFQQRAPQIDGYFIDPVTGVVRYELTYYSGDTVIIPIQARDNFPIFTGPTTNPTFDPDSIFVTFAGLPLSTTNDPATGCPFPPCMTVRGLNDANPPAPVATPPAPILVRRTNTVGDTTTRFLGVGYRGVLEVGAKLIWFPTCSNLPENNTTSCGSVIASNQVAITALDDNCPSSGKTTVTYTFRVKTLPFLPAPNFYGVSVNNGNTQATLHFFMDYDSTTIDPLDTINFFGYNAGIDSMTVKAKSVNRRRNSFQKYYVYRSAVRSGPFVRVDSMFNIDTYTWNDNNINAAVNDYYYYLTTVSSCGEFESAPSDTLKTIRLNLNNNILLGQAELSWDSTAVVHGRPYFPNATGTYYIDREVFTVTPGVWEPVDTVQDLYNYIQPVVVCNDSVNYRVGLLDTNGTVYYSRIVGDRFRDIFAPDSILIHHVSVDSTSGLPWLSWQPGPSPDVIKYYIYKININTNPPIATLLDSVEGYNNTIWFDGVSGQNPYDSALHYGVAGLDSCGNLGLISRRHSTIHLTGGLDQCISSIVFQWTDYVGWDNITEYEVYRSDAGGAWTLLTTVPRTTGPYNYVDNQGLIQDSLYCYSVVAKRASDDTIAISNTMCAVARVIQSPEYSYIRRVTVDSNTQLIHVLFAIDTSADARSFELYRASASTDFRQQTEWLDVDMQVVGGFRLYNYVDLTAEPHKDIYYYLVRIYDLCDQLLDTSNVSNNILAQGIPEIDFNNRLRWNSYQRWLGGVDRYEILRYIPNYDPGYLPLNQVGANSVVFLDDIKNFTDNDGLYTYIIKAVEASGNPAGFVDTVFSNRVEVIQQPRIFMPTAFIPMGVNRILQPKGVFIEELIGYNFEVYNRWGELLFQTNQMDLGWNGTHLNGSLVEPGVYVYVVNFVGKNGKAYSQNGTFTVIR
jgi:hypothetical protein